MEYLLRFDKYFKFRRYILGIIRQPIFEYRKILELPNIFMNSGTV